MDAVSLKEFLQTPSSLLVLMLAASLLGGIKQVIVSRSMGGEITLARYLNYWPETLATIIGNVIAFVVLILTDQLNFASALGIGYGMNSAADLLRPGGRSSAISKTEDKQ